MSQENVELVRGAFEVLAAEGVDASLSFFAPECVWYTTDRWLDGSAYRGHDGIRELDAAFAENFDDWRFEVRDIRDAQDQVVALTEMVGRIRGSASSVSQAVGFVISDFRGGTMGDIRAFATWADALDAAGLSE
jgi:ketosteroid isomerase-like protein